MKKGDKVQVWDEENHKPLGWGTIVETGYSAKDPEQEIPLILLESGRTIWGNRCSWISEKKACEIGIKLFRDIYEKSR